MELKITGTLVLDLADYIQAVEAVAGSYMLPNPEGLYMAGKCEPVLDRSKEYFYAGAMIAQNVAEAIPFNWNQPILADVLDRTGDIVLLREHALMLTDRPLWSPRARNLIVELIDHVMCNHARWTGSRAMPKVGPKQTNLHAVIRPFLLEQFQRSGISIDGVAPQWRVNARGYEERSKHREHVELDPVDKEGRVLVTEQDKQFFYMSIDICDAILLQLNDLFVQLLEFLGENRWIMHFSKVSNTQVSVEKSLDYRVYSWMLEHGRDYDD